MKILFVLFTVFFAVAGQAETKSLQCSLNNEKNEKPWVISIIMSDESTKAEVSSHGKDAPCVQNNSCKVYLYEKNVLPTIIRLISNRNSTHIKIVESIDINRQDLNVTSELHLNIDGDVKNDVFSGKCVVEKKSNKANLI